MASVTRLQSAPTKQDFDQAINRGAGTWYSACLRITGNDALAQDAVQDALTSAWGRRQQFRGHSRLETWIHRIAVNCALSLLRRQRPEAFIEPDEMAGNMESPADARRDQELARDLETALAELSEMERVCFVLKHLEQWRLAEVAEHLDANVGAVKQALFRALGKLRKSMLHLQEKS